MVTGTLPPRANSALSLLLHDSCLNFVQKRGGDMVWDQTSNLFRFSACSLHLAGVASWTSFLRDESIVGIVVDDKATHL